MPRKNHRTDDHGPARRGAGTGRVRPAEPAAAGGRTRQEPAMPALGDIEPPDDSFFLPARPFNVILSTHAARQMDDLGTPAQRALRYLQETGRDEIEWTAQPMPSQHGRDVWLLGAGPVRVLFDIEEDDLTVQGFGLQPRRSLRW